MIKCNSQYPSRVKYIKHDHTTQGTPTTKFQIGDVIKNTDPKQYINYTVTVYDDIPLNDGDEVTILSIDSLSVRDYNGKLYHDIVATVRNNAVKPASAFAPAANDTDADGFQLPFEL